MSLLDPNYGCARYREGSDWYWYWSGVTCNGLDRSIATSPHKALAQVSSPGGILFHCRSSGNPEVIVSKLSLSPLRDHFRGPSGQAIRYVTNLP
jgi:hypothetical protein